MALQQFEGILRPIKSAVGTLWAMGMPWKCWTCHMAHWRRGADFDSVSQALQQHFNVDIVAPAWRVGIRGSLVCMLQAGDMIV